MLLLLAACESRPEERQLSFLCGCAPATDDTAVQDRIPVVYDGLTDVILVVPQDVGSESLRLALSVQDRYLAYLGPDARLAVASAHPSAGGALVGEPVWLGAEGAEVFTERIVSLPALAQSPNVLAAALLAVQANAAELRPEARLDVILATHGTDSDDADEDAIAQVIAAAKDNPARVAVHCLYEDDFLPHPCYISPLFDGSIIGPVDFDTTDQLGFHLAGFPERYALSRLPGEGTLRVQVMQENGVVFDFDDVDWTYDGAENTVRFAEYVPDPGSTVILEYEPRDGVVE